MIKKLVHTFREGESYAEKIWPRASASAILFGLQKTLAVNFI